MPDGGTLQNAPEPPKIAPAQRAEATNEKPTAVKAAPTAMPKMMVEAPILRRSMPDGDLLKNEPSSLDPAPGQSLPDRMSPALWKKLATARTADVKLDEASRRFMMSKLPAESIRADERASGGVIDASTPFAKTLRNFEFAMAEDTVRNEFLFHTQIHQWLEDPVAGWKLAHDVDALNAKVYAELFLTPDHDAWLGLVPENIYTALEKDGCACDAMRAK
jgi:hypothetical protein